MYQRSVADSEEVEKFLRIASISIAIYDYVITLHAEWRFYRSQRSIWCLSNACISFILIRYVSILVMVISNYGVLASNFTAETCRHYYMAAPVLKVVQTMISQAILGYRTYHISLKNRRVGIALVALYFVSISVEWFTNMFKRMPVMVNGNCTPGNGGKTLTAYYYYITAMLYDLVVLLISIVYLTRYNPLSKRLGRLLHALIYEGIGYFVVLAAVNVLNIVFYHTSNVQNQASGAAVGYAVTWIMSQRLLIHRFGRDTPESEPRNLDVIVFSRPVHIARKAMSALRSKIDFKHSATTDLDSTLPSLEQGGGVELDIHVRVERAMAAKDSNGSEDSSSWRGSTS